MPRRGGDKRGNGRLHVRRAAAIEKTVGDFRRKRIRAPRAHVSRRHDIAVAGETEIGRRRADPGIEVFDCCRAGFFEAQPRAAKTDFTERLFEHAEGARIFGRHRRTAQEIAGKNHGISGHCVSSC